MKSKKSFIVIPIILLTIITIVCIASYFYHKSEKEQAIQTFGINETEELIIDDYSRVGLWNDQFFDISTQKSFDQFVNENITVPVIITDDKDEPLAKGLHTISFKYNIGNETIYGDFFIFSDKKTNSVTLRIID